MLLKKTPCSFFYMLRYNEMNVIVTTKFNLMQNLLTCCTTLKFKPCIDASDVLHIV